MSKKLRILYVTSEIDPFLKMSSAADLIRLLPQKLQEKGHEIRIFMPKFGVINERRNRLHEVVRLSGINIRVAGEEKPLTIKVASIPNAKLQVYFLDNEDFFKRKSVFTDDEGKSFEDNEDRMIFFCKGVIETVKKFGWASDIVHCHGWMTSLVPMYLKTAYRKAPLFQNAKLVYSLYNSETNLSFSDAFMNKASINNLEPEELVAYLDGNQAVDLHKGATTFADALIKGSENLNGSVPQLLEGLKKPILDFKSEDQYLAAYLEFYQTLLEQEEVSG